MIHLLIAAIIAAQVPRGSWPAYYEPALVSNITASTEAGLTLTLDRAYLLHRDDAERWLECKEALDLCLQARRIDNTQSENIWATVFLLGAGLLVGGLGGAVIVASLD